MNVSSCAEREETPGTAKSQQDFLKFCQKDKNHL